MTNTNQPNHADPSNSEKSGILDDRLNTAFKEALDKVRGNIGDKQFEELEQILKDPVKAGSKMIIEEARQTIQNTASNVLNSSKIAVGKVYETATNTVEAGVNLARNSGQSLQNLIAKINKTIGANPEEEKKLSDFFLQNGPIIGNVGTYTSGWRAYHTGKEKNDLEMKNKGRELCLCTLINLGIDGGTLGISFLTRNIHAGLKATLAVLSIPSISKMMGGADPAMYVAKKLLSNPKTRERAEAIADYVMECIKPESEKRKDQ